jgi:uroporphyrin-III C-methyltransferase/precorrin-2 dehydrogenase/sirohydrochlorin ferrochelatase
MRHFPAFLDLQGRTALVLGTGEGADRRRATLRDCGATVREAANFSPALLDGCVLAIGAEAPEADLRAMAEAANARGIPVNVIDRPDLCSFITPSIIDRDPITIAVSSGGAAPVLARLLRARIEAIIPPAYGRLAALADRFKSEIRRLLPDLATRRRVLERAFTGDVAELVFAGLDDQAAAALQAAIAQAPLPAGMVFLVGAGPGAGDLLTLRAQRLLGEADVIVHDRLVGTDVLAMARRDAERIYVGKARANHCMKQEDINALLIRLAQAGRKVIRLKGGDPFIFGRGGEEAEALRAAGITVEIVPGITAALACAAQAGIPLTHRAHARSLVLVTGHTSEGKLDVDFAWLARHAGTTAIYMGVASLPALAEGLLTHGLNPKTPAALIENGGRPEQRSLLAPLPQLTAQAASWTTGGPTLVLIGGGVGSHYENKPTES